jgi:hypothetical protein
MREGTSGSDLALDSIKALLNLSFLDIGKTRIMRYGGCQAVLDAMRPCSSNQALVEHGIRIMLNLAMNPANPQVIGEYGGCADVVGAMWIWIHDRSIVYYGLRTLLHLCVNNPANRVVAGERDAWKQAVMFLRVYPYDEAVVRFALQVIACLSLNEDNKSKFRLFRGIHTIVDTVEKVGRSSRGVTRAGLWAMLNLAMQHEQNRIELCEAQALDSASSALSMFESDSSVVFYSCSVFFYLCESPGAAAQQLTTVTNQEMFKWLHLMMTLLSPGQVRRLNNKKQLRAPSCVIGQVPKELIMLIARTLPSPLRHLA